jgi:predicted alpha/beta hydrolase family esterase
MAPSRFDYPSAAPEVLLLAELDCDGTGYWQDHWIASRIDCSAVDVGGSRSPDRNDRVARLDQACRRAGAPLILVGHGIGALTIAAWAALMNGESEGAVAGALLIAPSDPAADGADPRLQSFMPLPQTVFSFPALVVASDDDPAIAPDRAFSLARQWGAGFARFSGHGHFMPSDRLGWWPLGEMLLDCFIDMIEPGRRHEVSRLDDVASRFARVGRGATSFLLRP